MADTINGGGGTGGADASGVDPGGNFLDSIALEGGAADGAEGTGAEAGAADGADAGAEGEAESQAAAADGTEEVAADHEFDETIGAPQLVQLEDGSTAYQYSADQSRELQARAKLVSELEAVVPDLSVDLLRSHEEAFTDWRLFVNDVATGGPQAVQNFMGLIQAEGAGSPFAQELAQALLVDLKANNAPAYEQIRGGYEKDLGQEFFKIAKQAQQSPDARVRDGYRMLAELYHFHMNNERVKLENWKDEDSDPVAARDREIKRREDAVKAGEQRQKAQAQETWQRAVSADRNTKISRAIDEMLKPFEDRFKDPKTKKPTEQLNLLRQDLFKTVSEEIRKNPEWLKRFNVEYGRALASGNQQSAAMIVDMYLQRAKGILKAQLPKKLTSASNGAVAANKALHTAHANASQTSHRATGASGGPVRRSILPKANGAMKPEDYAAFLDQAVSGR